jgi:hypothetical protein
MLGLLEMSSSFEEMSLSPEYRHVLDKLDPVKSLAA